MKASQKSPKIEVEAKDVNVSKFLKKWPALKIQPAETKLVAGRDFKILRASNGETIFSRFNKKPCTDRFFWNRYFTFRN